MSVKRLLLFMGVLFAVTALAVSAADILKEDEETLLLRLSDRFLFPKTISVPENGKAVFVDLHRMELALYENGAATRTLPILSKGRRGTPWETPGGVYGILLKEKTHFSSLGHVYMPWSMQFYGNFFIHGWPYDLEGKDVPPGYSGGCVRLSTSDAEVVYRFVERKTPVIVVTKESEALSGGYYLKAGAPPPPVSALSLIAFDVDRGQILWKRGESVLVRDPLSAKFLASLASLESMNQYTPRSLPGRPPKDAVWLSRRAELPAKDLIAPLLYSEDTAVEELLAQAHGKSTFLRAMREKAAALGMTETEIADLGGNGTENTTTVSDLGLLLRGLDHSKGYLLQLTAAEALSVPGEKAEIPVVLVNDRAVPPAPGKLVGGLADLEHGNLAAIVELPMGATTRPIAIAMAGSHTVTEDMNTVLAYLSSSVEFVPDGSAPVIVNGPVSIFSRLRMIWNRKRAGEILLGESAPEARRIGLLSLP